jgi:hypothetical protein
MSWWQQTYRRMMYGPPVIVVSGLPRSGTSMMMKMLEAGGQPVWMDGVRAADDQNPRGYYELERVKELDKGLDKTWVRAGRGRAVKVISSLLEHLPATNNYQVIFMNRSMREVLDSQSKMLSRRGEAGGDVSDAALQTLYETHLRKVKHFLAHQPGFRALDVAYADVLADPAVMAHRIRTFLGANLDVAGMTGAVDEQLYRNRQEPPGRQTAHI